MGADIAKLFLQMTAILTDEEIAKIIQRIVEIPLDYCFLVYI
jgi:hypothetical protein